MQLLLSKQFIIQQWRGDYCLVVGGQLYKSVSRVKLPKKSNLSTLSRGVQAGKVHPVGQLFGWVLRPQTL